MGTRFKSTLYPELRVADIGVKFTDGVAEVTGKAAIKRLDGLTDLGVTRDDTPKPRRTAKAAPSTAQAPDPDTQDADDHGTPESAQEDTDDATGDNLSVDVDSNGPDVDSNGPDVDSNGPDVDTIDPDTDTPDAAAEVVAPKGNATRDEWASYAESIGVVYPPGATRDQIRMLVAEYSAGN